MSNRLTAVPAIAEGPPRAAEFFAGVGLARLGLERAGFRVVWSNDIEADKKAMYVGHFADEEGTHHFELGDVGEVAGDDMPGGLSLAWASSPCTDLSLAGSRAGLSGAESGSFWNFTRVIEEMGPQRPPVITLENVVGLATSHGGDDLAAAIAEMNRLEYSVDVVTIDARRFIPQSRPRLFLIGSVEVPTPDPRAVSELRPDWLQGPYNDTSLITHRALLPELPPPLTSGLGELAEKFPSADSRWWDAGRTADFLSSLSEIQAQRLRMLRSGRTISYRTAYRRTRHGAPVWEIRADDVAGCLRTARGGSSKQAIVKAGRGQVSVRWMTPLEYARLMGAGYYRLDGVRDNQALFGFGDAVAVPAVEWLAENYLMPLIRGHFEFSKGRGAAKGA